MGIAELKTPEDIKEVLEYLGLEVLLCENYVPDRSDSFVVVGRK